MRTKKNKCKKIKKNRKETTKRRKISIIAANKKQKKY